MTKKELASKIHQAHSHTRTFDVEAAVAEGMLRKDQLVPGTAYVGACRNASVARWTGHEFIYLRRKFGMQFEDVVNHPEDDDGHDIFVPVAPV
jgi:hypothetical protein